MGKHLSSGKFGVGNVGLELVELVGTGPAYDCENI